MIKIVKKGIKIKKSEISNLPKTTGVYLFYDKKGEILYIGKATNIRERVKSHFKTPAFKDGLFLEKVEKISFKETDSEIEALLKEAELIKKHQPKFNVLWRDDKNYFYIGITNEEFPRIFLTHQPIKQFNNLTTKQFNKIEYIGPFVDGRALKKTLRILRKTFPYRTCKKIAKRPCLWYQMGLCPGPCLLNSGVAPQIPGLKEKIEKESQQNARALLKILQGKKIQLLKYLKKEMKKLSQAQKYERAAEIRDRIEALERISQYSGIFKEFEERKGKNWEEIERELRKILDQKFKIKRIEGYDISNIQGSQAAGSMVVFEKGIPNKNEYRKFKMKIDGKPNDVAMLKEVLTRRFNHPEWSSPQLILIDGGRAQFNAALKIKDQKSKIKITNQKPKVIALAKKNNKLFVEGRKKPILLKSLPREIFNLILQLRDEAHRFAISYHRKLREKKFIK